MIITLSILLAVATWLVISTNADLKNERNFKEIWRKRYFSQEKELNLAEKGLEDSRRVAQSRLETLKTTENYYLEEKRKRELYEKALKTVDPNKLAIINQGHALGTAQLGFTQLGGVIQTKKHRSDYTTAGQVVDRALGSDWSVAK